jgi:Putative zinc-finger
MISCADFMSEMGSYLDNDVAEQVRKQLEEHLAHCQTCTVLVDSARKTIRIVTESATFDLPETAFKPITADIMSRIRSDKR